MNTEEKGLHELAISILTTKRSHEESTLKHLAEWKVKNDEAIAIKEDTIKQLTRSILILIKHQETIDRIYPRNTK